MRSIKRLAGVLLAAALVAAAVPAAGEEDLVRLSIVFTNDMHGGIDRSGATFMNREFPPPLGGAASAAAYIGKLRERAEREGGYVLVLDQGDIFQGTPVGNFKKGESVIEYFGHVGVDAWTVGNHDFDEGYENLCDVLCAAAVFRRLRRIKQLGVSEFVYPSAAHTRFAHSIGVFHNARRLLRIIEREIDLKRVEGEFDPHRASVAVLAALLHDIGHGPFSHTFEEARKALAEERGNGAARAKVRKHEVFTADMIEDPKGIQGWTQLPKG